MNEFDKIIKSFCDFRKCLNDEDMLKNFEANIKSKTDVINTCRDKKLKNIFNDSLEIKKISTRVDEIIHLTGILCILNKIMLNDEKIEKLSLGAAGRNGDIDIISNKRIAEIKFSYWNQNSSNGVRVDNYVKDIVKLILSETDDKLLKELYIYNRDDVIASLKKSKRKINEKLKNDLKVKEIKLNNIGELITYCNKEQINFIEIEEVLK